PLSPWSLPSPRIPFPPLPPILSPPSPVLSPAPPPSPIRSLGYRTAMIRLRAEATSTSHSPPLQLPSASRRQDRPEVTLPPRKKLGIALGPEYEAGESSSAAAARPARGFKADYGFVATINREIMHDPEREVGYGITDSWDEIVETLQGAPVSTDTKLGGYMREFETRVRLLAISSPPASPLSPWSLPSPRIPFPPLPPILSPPSPVEIMRDPKREVGYGITDSWDEIVETLQGAPVSTDTELGRYMREFETRVRQDTDEIYMRQDTDEIYMRLDDEQTERQLLAGWLNMLFRDRRVHAYTRHLMETEARMSREAWVRSTDASDLVRGEVMSLRTTVLGQMTEIRELQAVDRRRQTAHVTALQGQQGLAGGPTQPELPEEAGSGS
nr:hypothetical protein [Tanacetum cinerariifolium]